MLISKPPHRGQYGGTGEGQSFLFSATTTYSAAYGSLTRVPPPATAVTVPHALDELGVAHTEAGFGYDYCGAFDAILLRNS